MMLANKCTKIMAAAAALLVTVSCAATTNESPASPDNSDAPAGSKEISNDLPDYIIDKNHIVNLSQVPNVPMEYTEEGSTEVIGVDIDIIRAIGDVLGIEIRQETTQDFSSLLPALETGRTDIVISGMIDREERHEVASFVDYLDTFAVLIMESETAGQHQELESFCGEAVIGHVGTLYPQHIAELSEQTCEAAGLPKIDVLEVDGVQQILLQLEQKRAVAAMMAIETFGWEEQQTPGKWQHHPERFGAAPYGIAFRSEDEDLGDAISSALDELKESGQYGEILKKWGMESTARTTFPINSAVAESN